MDLHGPQGVHGVPRAPWGPQAPWSRMGPIDPMGPMGSTHGTYGPHRPHGPHGVDPWYLKTIPEGALDEDDYNFLHGYPTASPIKFWYHRRDENNGQHDATPCHYSAYFIQEHLDEWPVPYQKGYECINCWTERKRRARVLCVHTHPERARQRLTDTAFKEAVLITPYNVAVFYFAQQRAMHFAKRSQAASFWIQATDSRPSWFANGYTHTELLQQKKKWLSYHARKTEGILSLLLCCYDMPFRVTNSNGHEFKKYGIFNGASCRLKAWELSEEDQDALKHADQNQIIFIKQPVVSFLEMVGRAVDLVD